MLNPDYTESFLPEHVKTIISCGLAGHLIKSITNSNLMLVMDETHNLVSNILCYLRKAVL